MRENLKEIFGSEVIDTAGPAWGLDDEDEIRGCFRPTGYPGVSTTFVLCDPDVTIVRSSGIVWAIWRLFGSIHDNWCVNVLSSHVNEI